jgi:hypothetical protein
MVSMIFRCSGDEGHHKRCRQSQEQKQCTRPRYKLASNSTLAFGLRDSRLRTCISEPLQLQAKIMGGLPPLIWVFGQTVPHQTIERRRG